MDSNRFFEYGVDRRYLPVCILFGFRPKHDGVTVTADTLRATFGFFQIEVPIANITGAHVTRNYRWWTAPGVRGSWVDDGLSYGSNREAGVCIHFREKVPTAIRRSGHSALTVTVADVDGLANLLDEDSGA